MILKINFYIILTNLVKKNEYFKFYYIILIIFFNYIFLIIFYL